VLVAALPQRVAFVVVVVVVAVAAAAAVVVLVVAADDEEETAVVAVVVEGTARVVGACSIVVGVEPLQRDYPSTGEPGCTNQPQLGETEKSEAGEMAASLNPVPALRPLHELPGR